MNNWGSYENGSDQPRKKGLITRRLLATGVLGVVAVVLCFKLGGWNVGCTALILVLPVAIMLGPRKARRLLLTLYLVFFVALVSGSLLQSRLASPAMLSIAERNVIVRFFVGGFAEQVLIAAILGLLTGLLVVGGFLFVILWTSSEFVLALHEVSGVKRWDALRYMWSLAMGVNLPWMIVEDGKVKKTKPEGILTGIGGPGVVVIRPGSAAVFEWGGKVTKIEGPGVFKIDRFERIKKAVDLRPQWHPLEVTKVLTKDRIPLTFEISVGYQVQPKIDNQQAAAVMPTAPEVRGAIEGVYPVFKEAVYRAVYGIDPTSPEDAVKGVSGAFLRDEILKHSLDDLYDYSAADMPKTRGNVIEAIEGAVQPRLAEILEDWGLKLLGVDISTVEMPEDIKAKVLQWWATAWESERLGVQAEGERHAMAERGRGQAQALTAVEEEKARIGQQLIHNLISTLSGATINLNPLIAARILKLLEVLLARMACDSVTALRQLDTLEKLLEGEGSKTLVIGEPPSMLLRGEEKT